MLALIVEIALLVAQKDGASALAAFDRLVEFPPVENATLPSGTGRSERIDYMCDFAGLLHIWTSAAPELDLCLRVEDSEGNCLLEDDDSGGGLTPYVRLEVAPGTRLRLIASAKPGKGGGAFAVHIVAAPETAVTLAFAKASEAALKAIDLGRTSPDRATSAAAIEKLLGAIPTARTAARSDALAAIAWRCGVEAIRLPNPGLAKRAWGRSLDLRMITLPPDHPELQKTRLCVGITLRWLGEFQRSKAVEQDALASLSRTVPADATVLQTARSCLADTLCAIGDFDQACAVQEQVVEVWSASRPAGHALIQIARLDLARIYRIAGRQEQCQALEEEICRVPVQPASEDWLLFLAVRVDLASELRTADRRRADALADEVTEILAGESHRADRTDDEAQALLSQASKNEGIIKRFDEALAALSDDPEDFLRLQRVAVSTDKLTAFFPRRYEELMADVLASLERLVEEMAGDRVRPKQAGTTPAARRKYEVALEEYERAQAERKADREYGAIEAHRKLIAGFADSLADDDPNQINARCAMIVRLAMAEDRKQAAELASDVLRRVRSAIHVAAMTSSPREAEFLALRWSGQLSTVIGCVNLYAQDQIGRVLAQTAFELVETTRGAGMLPAEVIALTQSDRRFNELRDAARATSAELAFAARLPVMGNDVAAMTEARDRVQRDLVESVNGVNEVAARLQNPTLAAFAGKLAENQALVSYWRCEVPRTLQELGSNAPRQFNLVAFVFRKTGRPQCIALGSLEIVREKVHAWRSAVESDPGSPAARGVSLEETPQYDGPSAERLAGEALRKAIADPLMYALRGTTRWTVALDDDLHLVPLDALPSGDGVLGDKLTIEVRMALREILHKPRGLGSQSGFVVAGGASFDAVPQPLAAPGAEDMPDPSRADSSSSESDNSPSERTLLRGGPWEAGFSNLPATQDEVEAVLKTYRAALGDSAPAVALLGASASVPALAAIAPHCRFLHIATHGWCAADTIRSFDEPGFLERASGPDLGLSASRVIGLSPMSLCGLALAGANLPPDTAGRFSGLVSAEEIASWDLANCELAVLSACETNIGFRRAGQGVASLQRALQMAGSRSVITSLWRVPDAATKELMSEFYRLLWLEKKPKLQALWEAKRKLRDAKDASGKPLYTTRDWAAWVLTGEPQ